MIIKILLMDNILNIIGYFIVNYTFNHNISDGIVEKINLLDIITKFKIIEYYYFFGNVK